ncbi:MAG TPA: hypothetical protein VKV37_08255 [Ktedonobacteraceae bacterium]|jgi:RimJ/RimL family protein N-acetyltransferase|nr:hypothetical protein [Ktedonobacteraceae bacterium]
MSQQELVPDPQNGPSQDYDEQYMLPRQRPAKRRDSDLLKEEHPSTFESSIPSYSYQARDEAASIQRRAPVERAEGARRQRHFSSDGDAFEYGYRPYRQYTRAQQVPPWARPQQHRSRGIVFWIVLIALALALVKALPLLIALIAGVIGLVAFAILLPVFIILIVLALLAIIAMVVLIALGVPIFGWFLSRSHRRQGGPGQW